MKINAICVVKNEADIIEETLLNAMKFCHRIYIFDNHSDDGTWEIVQNMAVRFKQIVMAVRSDEAYRPQLRNRIYNMYHHLYDENDWWYIVNANELLHTSPRPLLEKALRADKNRMDVWLANFYFTDEDQRHYGLEDTRQTVTERRRFYRINWREARFFKNDPCQKWPENITACVPLWADKSYRKAPVCRHYAERTPEQMNTRDAGRAKQTTYSVNTESCKATVCLKQASKLHRYNKDGNFTFSTREKLHFYLKASLLRGQEKIKSLASLFSRPEGSNKVKSAVHLTKGH